MGLKTKQYSICVINSRKFYFFLINFKLTQQTNYCYYILCSLKNYPLSTNILITISKQYLSEKMNWWLIYKFYATILDSAV